MNVPPKCDLLLIGFWDTPAADDRGPGWQTTPHASVSSAHAHTGADILTHAHIMELTRCVWDSFLSP